METTHIAVPAGRLIETHDDLAAILSKLAPVISTNLKGDLESVLNRLRVNNYLPIGDPECEA